MPAPPTPGSGACKSSGKLRSIPADEPRLAHFAGRDGATARHPLFWSGYVLIDTGWSPAATEPATSDAQFVNGTVAGRPVMGMPIG